MTLWSPGLDSRLRSDKTKASLPMPVHNTAVSLKPMFSRDAHYDQLTSHSDIFYLVPAVWQVFVFVFLDALDARLKVCDFHLALDHLGR